MNEDIIATPEETVRALLDQSRRDAVPIRTTFVQHWPQPKRSAPGPLSAIVTSRDEIGLDLYLLAHALASSEPWDVARPAEVWARALRHTGRTVTTPGLSKVWRRLADRRLVIRGRHGRTAKVTLLREDGTGEPYAKPRGANDRYLKLPHAYWMAEWCKHLGLPAKAMLLVALAQRPGFALPLSRVPAWYGLSEDTAQRGVRQLSTNGLLGYEEHRKPAPLAPEGFTLERRYTLLGDFARPSTTKET